MTKNLMKKAMKCKMKVILITGASSGIGFESALILAA